MLRPLLLMILTLTTSTWAHETLCFCPAEERRGRCTQQEVMDSEPRWEGFTGKWFCRDDTFVNVPKRKCGDFTKTDCPTEAKIICSCNTPGTCTPPLETGPPSNSIDNYTCHRKTMDQDCNSFERRECTRDKGKLLSTVTSATTVSRPVERIAQLPSISSATTVSRPVERIGHSRRYSEFPRHVPEISVTTAAPAGSTPSDSLNSADSNSQRMQSPRPEDEWICLCFACYTGWQIFLVCSVILFNVSFFVYTTLLLG